MDDGGRRRVGGKSDCGKKIQTDAMLVDLKMEEDGHKSSNVSGLQKLEKIRKQILS